MSIEDSINALTAAIKELTTQLGFQQQDTSSTAVVGNSVIVPPEQLELDLQPREETQTAPEKTTEAPTKSKGKTKGVPETVQEAPKEAPAKKVKVATYEDAATVLISKDKTARKALIKEFKGDAEKLVDLADLGEDIWARVLEAAKALPEKA